MRFDYRGLGDSGGIMRSFQNIGPDIAAAIDAFTAACPSLHRVVLWGLCDAASAGLLYWEKTADPRVMGLVLLNPWVRSEESLARVRVKHYYGQRFLEREFWRKLTRGGINFSAALRSFVGTLITARVRRDRKKSGADAGFQQRMASAIGSFGRPILLILSGRDLTAKEFLDYAKSNPLWTGLIERINVERCELQDSDHTFSTAAWRQEVEALTLDWLQRSFDTKSQ